MNHWFDDEVLSYCQSDGTQRSKIWESGEAAPPSSRPWCVIPLFEIFRVVFRIAPWGRARLDEFRSCWIDTASTNAQRCADGYIVRIFERIWGETDNPVRDMWPIMMQPPTARVSMDARGDDESDRAIFNEYFRRLARSRYEFIAAEEELVRCWSEPIPDELRIGLAGRIDLSSAAGDVVLDTNMFVELLDELPVEGRGKGKFFSGGRSARSLEQPRIRKRFDSILATRGSSGKFIVPLPVLIETFGVIRERSGANNYQNARNVMRALSLQGDQWPLWQVFNFDDLSFGLLEAYLLLFETLIARGWSWERRLSFMDSLILAYGLLNFCPVISSEWHEKDDWLPVEDCFKILRTGSNEVT